MQRVHEWAVCELGVEPPRLVREPRARGLTQRGRLHVPGDTGAAPRPSETMLAIFCPLVADESVASKRGVSSPRRSRPVIV